MNEEKKEEVDFLKHLLEKPTKKKSRKVTEKDMEKVVADSHIMFNLCFTQIGLYPGGLAVHHSQIDGKNPLDFFVTAEKEIIINPVIINHTKVLVDRQEACLSFRFDPPKTVERYNKVTVKYEKINTEGKTDTVEENMSGRRAQMFQHEIDYGKAKYIY